MNAHSEIEVIIPGEYELSGTMAMPVRGELPLPAVVFIHGSGKTDRDGNPNRRIRLNIYKQLSDALVEKGWVTFRYDKRGCGKSKGDFLKTGLHDLMTDAQAVIAYLRTRSEVDPNRIFLLGHSEGAMIAPAVQQKLPVRGLILIAGSAETLGNALRRQAEQALTEIRKMSGLKGWMLRVIVRCINQEKQVSKLFAKVKQSDRDVVRLQGVVPINAKWIREHLTYDVLDVMKTIDCPVLAITGDRDIQVNPEDVVRLTQTANGIAEWHIVENMNHVLQPYFDKHSMLKLVKEYRSNPNKHTHPTLIRLIHDWLERNAQEGS